MMTVPCKCQESKDSETELTRLGHPHEMGWGRGRSQDGVEVSSVSSWTDDVIM